VGGCCVEIEGISWKKW